MENHKNIEGTLVPAADLLSDERAQRGNSNCKGKITRTSRVLSWSQPPPARGEFNFSKPLSPSGLQRTNPSTRQPFSPPTLQPANPLTRQPFNSPTLQPAKPSTNQPISPSAFWPTCASPRPPICQPALQSINASTRGRCNPRAFQLANFQTTMVGEVGVIIECTCHRVNN